LASYHPGIEYLLAAARIPCEQPAATALVRDIARKARLAGLFYKIVAAWAMAAAFIFNILVPRLPAVYRLYVVALGLVVAVIVLVLGGRESRVAGELEALAAELERGMLEEYCGRTVLEALYSYRARRGGAARVLGGPAWGSRA